MKTLTRLLTLIVVAPLLTAAPALASADGGIRDSLSSMGEKLGLGGSPSQQQAFLEPDQAFVISAEAAGSERVIVRWQIAEGYYLYRDKFAFRVVDGAGLTLGDAEFPTGKFKEDEFFGRMEVYYREVAARLPVLRGAGGEGRSRLVVEADFQGCADAGFCYPPMTRDVELVLPARNPDGAAGLLDGSDGGFAQGVADGSTTVVSDGGGSTASLAAASSGDPVTAALPAQDRIARSLAEGALWVNLAAFFGFGLLLAFTPCVLPMVPILSSLIIGQKDGVTTRRAFLLSLSFVLAMALTYTVAGVMAGLFGSNLQIMFQNPWVIAGFSAAFVLLALSMFGFYELQMPAAWQTRLSSAGNQGAGTYAGAGILGFFSALVVGPCVAAPLAGILIYIGMSGDALLGGVSLFALSLGMGTPLLLLGASAGRLLPKAGQWMNTVKAVFGVLMLGVAIWLLERIVPAQVAMLLWASLLIGSAVYLGAFDRLERGVPGWSRLSKGAGLVMFLFGTVLIVGAASGGRDVFQPLSTLSVATAGPEAAGSELEFRDIKGLDGVRAEVTRAAAAGRPVMLDFYADWCVDCKTMERRTFSDPEVRQLLSGAVLLRADVTGNDAADRKLLRSYDLFGPPAVLFFDEQGAELAGHRLVGYLGPQDFISHVRRAWF